MLNSNTQIPVLPKTGDKIYIPDDKSPGKGIDDKIGGWAIISNTVGSTEDNMIISTYEHSGKFIKWFELKNKQEELKNKFGYHRAVVKPDVSEDNNYLVEYYRK